MTTETTTVMITRTIPGAQEDVYAAWTDHRIFGRWFAPDAHQVAEIDIDVRVGGHHRTTVVGPDGSRHTTTGVYTELDPPKRLAMTWNYSGDHPDAQVEESHLTVEFVALGEAMTEVRLAHDRMLTERGRNNVRTGWHGCLDKLERLFGTERGIGNIVTVSRVIDAPAAAIYQAFLDPEHHTAWGPTRFTNTPVTGGTYHQEVDMDEHTTYVVTGVYRELVPNRLIDMTFNHGPKGSKDITPFEVRLSFDPVDTGGSRVTVIERGDSIVDAVPGDAYHLAWEQVFESLAAYVEQRNTQ